MKAKVRNGLIGSLAFVLVLTLALMCTFSLGELSIASAEDAQLEVTHFVGMRSNTPRIYWRLDATDYTANFQLASAVECKYTTATGEVTAKVNIAYATAGGNKGPGVTSAHDSGTQYPCLYFTTDQTAAAGDTLTIPSGTILKGSDGTNKYILDQDYTFVYNGGWSFADSSVKIPVGLYGVSNGGRANSYFQAYCDSFIGDYYAANTALTQEAKAQFITGDTTTETTVTIKYLTSSSNLNANEPTLQIQGFSALNVVVGDKIVLKKGTTVFDNFTFDRDYTFTFIGTNCSVSNCWSMTASTYESDPEMTLSVRGGAAGYLNLFTPQEHPYVTTGAQYYFAMNAEINVNGSSKYVQRMHGLAKSGDNYSFGIEFGASYTAVAGDRLTIAKGTYLLGYRVAKDYFFVYDGSKWTIVECDGTNHIYNDNFTCHDRTCACGHVSEATTEHKYAEGDEVCEERNCTDCGEAATPAEHTFEANTYDCQDRTCTVCSNLIEATGEHTPDSDACDAKCTKCQQSFGNHEFAAAPEGGWTVDSEGLIVTTQPDCTETGLGTVKCANCTVTEEVVVNALGHNVPNGGTHCDRTGCDYRIPFTAADMEEILALESLTKYVYGDSHVVDDGSIFGTIRRTDDSAYDNNFLINSSRVGETPEGKGIFAYDEGKDAVHNMMFSFSVNISDWASASRQAYVWLMGHENGSWGIGFMFNMNSGAQNVRIVYKSDDSGYKTFADPVALTGFALNETQSFDFGVVQNSDGSFFAFGYYNDELIINGTLSTETIASGNANNHYGLGGAIAVGFNGSTGGPSVVGTICNKTHVYEGTQYVCKDYACGICGTIKAHTAEHSWGEALKTGEGDCDTKEEFTRTCITCSDITKFEGDYVHEWDTENPVEVSPAQCNNVNQVVKYGCKHCEEESQNQEVVGSGIEGTHEYDFVVVTPSTCSQPGSGHDVCTKCGDEATLEEVPVDPTAHAYGTEVAEVAPSCGVVGTAAHYECEYCNKLFTKSGEVYTEVQAADLVIPAACTYGAEIPEVPATCTTNGTAAHYECSGCHKLYVKDGEVYTEVQAADLVIPASCTKVLVSEVPATCTTNGVREHYECSVCGKLYLRSEHLYTPVDAEDLVIEAGHKYVNGVCSVCQERDEVYFFNQAISAVTSATSAEAKFEKLSAAIAQFNLLTAEEKTANASALDAQIDAYNALVASANAAHNAQSDLLANILKLLAQITALTSAAAVGLFLSKLNA